MNFILRSKIYLTGILLDPDTISLQLSYGVYKNIVALAPYSYKKFLRNETQDKTFAPLVRPSRT